MAPMVPRDGAITPKRRLDYRAPAFLVAALELEFDLDPEATLVRATFGFRRNPGAADQDRAIPLILDGEQQDDVEVTLDGRALAPDEVAFGPGTLTIANPPDVGTLSVSSHIAPARNVALEGLYVSSGVFCTQCEPEGFRRITYFPDRPDVLARYRVTLRADRARYPQLLSNGNRVAAGPLEDGRHFVTWEDPFPKPSYLFALVAGDLGALEDSFTTMDGRKVALRIHSTPANLPRCHHAMESLKRAMRWDEERYGRAYDLDTFMIFCADDFNMGAMENKGLNIFNSAMVLADPATATDADFNAIEGIVGHEYFHNWTGDRVTCRDWFQLSLKEGLTVYRDQEFSADQGSRAVRRIGDVRRLRAAQFPEDAGPLAHPVQPQSYIRIDNFYTATVYNKGAELVRMIETILGRDGFRKGMDLYFRRHDNHAVTIEDFVAAMQDANGVDLGRFKRWYHQAGTPEITIEDHYDQAARRYDLTVRQETPLPPGQPVKEPLVVPLAAGFVGPDGGELCLDTQSGDASRALILSEAQHTFRFVDVAAQPVPSLLRGFSAPVRLKGLAFERLRFLALHDSDPFNRWEATQQVATRILLGRIEAARRGAAAPVDDALGAVLRAALEGAERDPAFAAELLTLPGESYLADQCEVVDVDAIHVAREAARAAVGRDLAADLASLHERLADHGPYLIDGLSIGRRKLRNTALAYLAVVGGEDGIVRA